jgi:hypothetical protein
LTNKKVGHHAAEIPGDPGHHGDDAHGVFYLLLVAALNPRTTEEFAVLLLGHSLTSLLDHRAHELPLLPRPPAAPGICASLLEAIKPEAYPVP